MIKKILQIGCGGVGSNLIKNICTCIEKEQVNPYTEITIADNDIVEIDQLRYQDFKINEVGKSKAVALAARFKEYGIKAINKRIEKESQLKNYDLIIMGLLQIVWAN